MRETDPLLHAQSPPHSETSGLPATTVHSAPAAHGDSIAPPTEHKPQQEKLSWKARAKLFFVEYGAVGICVHIVLSVAVVALAYVCVSNGVDVSALLSAIGLEGDTAKGSTAHSAGSFVIAYAIYKLLAPVRVPLTFAVTPLVMRALRRRGYMLPPAATDASSSSPSTPLRHEAAIEMV